MVPPRRRTGPTTGLLEQSEGGASYAKKAPVAAACCLSQSHVVRRFPRPTSSAKGSRQVVIAWRYEGADRDARPSTKAARPDERSSREASRHRYDLVHYVLEIQRWKWDYDFGVHWSVHQTYEVKDYAHLNVYGTVISPDNVAGRQIELTFIPERHGARYYIETPDWLGTLWRAGRGKDLEAIFPMPADMLAPVSAVLTADRYHYVSLEGEQMSRREAGIRHYSFRRALMDDDLPLLPSPWPSGKPLPDLRRHIVGR